MLELQRGIYIIIQEIVRSYVVAPELPKVREIVGAGEVGSKIGATHDTSSHTSTSYLITLD